MEEVWAVRECVPYEINDVHSLWKTEEDAQLVADELSKRASKDWSGWTDYVVTVKKMEVR